MSEDTATAIAGRDHQKALERYQRDARFRAIVQSVAHDVLGRHPDFQNRDGHRLAEDIAATLLDRIFDEDAELRAQRDMADRYRKIAEDTLALSAARPLIFPPPTGTGDRE